VFTKKHMRITVDRPIVSGEEPQQRMTSGAL
jgi:hypothetical protein